MRLRRLLTSGTSMTIQERLSACDRLVQDETIEEVVPASWGERASTEQSKTKLGRLATSAQLVASIVALAW